METTDTVQRWRSWLMGGCVGVLLALLLWPATRWMVRMQLVQTVPGSCTAWSSVWFNDESLHGADAMHATALAHPDEFALQFADTLNRPPTAGALNSETMAARLRQLAARFPNSPSLYATILRFEAQGHVRIYRNEEKIVTGEAMTPLPPVSADYNTPEQLAAFDRDAAAGERLDPDNAYFPFLRAAGLFVAHRDAAALAALKRAARKTGWNEYYQDEAESAWQLQERTFGPAGAMPRTIPAFNVLLPQYAQMRAASRLAVYHAMQAEQAGNPAEGFAIRKAVRSCGSLMRVESRSLIGNLVGIAITKASLLRPGGAAALHAEEFSLSDSVQEQLVSHYADYLQRSGQGKEIAPLRAEIAAGNAARRLITREVNGMQGAGSEPFDMRLTRLGGSWIVNMLLLANALWMLALGGVAGALKRSRRVRNGEALPPYIRRGIALSLLSGMCLAPIAIAQNSLAGGAWLAAVTTFGAITLLWPGMPFSSRMRALGVYGASWLSIALASSLITWQARGSVEPAAWWIRNTVALMGSHSSGFFTQQITALSVIGAFAVPLLTLLTLSILSLLWRVPLSVGVARGLRGCAVPLACGLLLAYGLSVPFTLRQENRVSEGLNRTVQHEGRYIAEHAGKAWPGAAR